MLPRAFLCPTSLCLSVCVRRWLWKLAGLYNREEPRVIKKRANDCLSIEYFPGKKCRGVRGEKKIWAPDMLCSSSQVSPGSQAEPCPPPGLGGGAEEPLRLSKDNQTENALQNAVQCLLKCHTQSGMQGRGGWQVWQHCWTPRWGMPWYVWMLKWIVGNRFWNHSCEMFVLQQIGHKPTKKAHWNILLLCQKQIKKKTKKQQAGEPSDFMQWSMQKSGKSLSGAVI